MNLSTMSEGVVEQKTEGKGPHKSVAAAWKLTAAWLGNRKITPRPEPRPPRLLGLGDPSSLCPGSPLTLALCHCSRSQRCCPCQRCCQKSEAAGRHFSVPTSISQQCPPLADADRKSAGRSLRSVILGSHVLLCPVTLQGAVR